MHSLKSSHNSFYLKGMFFKVTQKAKTYIWATLVKKCVTKKFRKLPNLVTRSSRRKDEEKEKKRNEGRDGASCGCYGFLSFLYSLEPVVDVIKLFFEVI